VGNFSVSGRDILLNGQEFEVKGICYQPTAIGENPITPELYYGDFYYTDANTSGIDEEFPARWARDFANFKKLGVNVIRVYQWDPNLDHSAFMAEAASNGIYILVNRYINPDADFSDQSGASGYQPSAEVQAYASEWSAIATEVANNPGVMGLLIGNEANNTPNDLNFYTAMNYLAGVVKGIAPNKLVSAAITDRMDQVANYNSTVTNFDFWAMQLYRGDSFGAFFAEYSTFSGKPVIITESGHDAFDGTTDTEFPNDAEIPAEAIEDLWFELRTDDLGLDIVSGICFFEYADEWWKDTAAAQPGVQDPGPRWAFPINDSSGNEEWWGIMRLVDDGTNIDILEPRAGFYRLASMWNPPHPITLLTSELSGDLRIGFSYPIHLRDQILEVEQSSDLSTWTKVADNATSTYLTSSSPEVIITNTEVGQDVLIKIDYDPIAYAGLLLNGGFETGDTTGWTFGGPVTSSVAQAGTYSLELPAGGGFSVPSALQTIAASPGEEFNLSGYMYTSAILPAGATFGLFKIVFEDNIGNDLEPASVSIGQLGPGDNPGGESLPFLNAGSPVGAWVFSEVQAIAPPGTATVSFFILNVDESANTMYFDSVEALNLTNPSSTTLEKVFFRVKSLTREPVFEAAASAAEEPTEASAFSREKNKMRKKEKRI
jgi:hypothetical protein